MTFCIFWRFWFYNILNFPYHEFVFYPHAVEIRSKLFYDVLEKWISENVRGPLCDDVIYGDILNLWSNEVINE